MLIRYSAKSAPSARLIAEQSDDIEIARHGYGGDVNWGKAGAGTTLNPDIGNVTNKRVMRELFYEYNVPIPGPVGIESALHNYSWPIVGRPDTHMKGRGFWLCHSIADVRRALRGTRRKVAATHFMEYIEHDREYRVHIFKGKSIRISQKAWDDDDLPMYKKSYTTVKPDPDSPIKEVRRAAKKAIEAVGLDFGAVDIITNDDGIYVLEVNAAPGLGGSMPRVYAETFLAWERGEWGD